MDGVFGKHRATKPFQPRRRQDFLADAEITSTIEHGHGDTAAAARTLTDLRRRAVEAFGMGNPELDSIEAAMNLLGGR